MHHLPGSPTPSIVCLKSLPHPIPCVICLQHRNDHDTPYLRAFSALRREASSSPWSRGALCSHHSSPRCYQHPATQTPLPISPTDWEYLCPRPSPQLSSLLGKLFPSFPHSIQFTGSQAAVPRLAVSAPPGSSLAVHLLIHCVCGSNRHIIHFKCN